MTVYTERSFRADGRIEWLDLLRGVSAFAIVLFHVRVTMWIGLRALAADSSYSWIDRATAWITLPFPFFGSAVMLFFIVSGFAIHYPYARAGGEFITGPYVARRFFRIYPPYFVVLFLTLAAEYVASRLAGWPVSSWTKVGSSVFMTQNYVAPVGQMAGNPSLWSLPVEVELYLVYPLVLCAWRAIGTRRLIAGVSVISIAAGIALVGGQQWPMGNFAKYWIIWMSGAVLAEWVRTDSLPEWRAWYWSLAGGGVVLAAACRAAGVPVGLEHFVWGGTYFLVVLWGLNRPGSIDAIPHTIRRAALFLGSISYSLYLVHFPVLLALGSGWIAVFGHKPASVVVPLLASLVPLPVAYLLWRFVERPSQAFGRVLSQTPAPAPAGSVAAV